MATTPHDNGNNFIPKLGSLSKTNVRTLDLMIMEFVNVIDKRIHIKKNLAYMSGIHCQENELETTNFVKIVRILVIITYF